MFVGGGAKIIVTPLVWRCELDDCLPIGGGKSSTDGVKDERQGAGEQRQQRRGGGGRLGVGLGCELAGDAQHQQERRGGGEPGERRGRDPGTRPRAARHL